jgi:NTP pyrophosphatase (non-canonical NTP hydrolase)
MASALTAETSEVIKAIEKLNGRGKWITLQQVLALQEHEDYSATWTGYFQGVKREENIIYPVWK